MSRTVDLQSIGTDVISVHVEQESLGGVEGDVALSCCQNPGYRSQEEAGEKCRGSSSHCRFVFRRLRSSSTVCFPFLSASRAGQTSCHWCSWP